MDAKGQRQLAKDDLNNKIKGKIDCLDSRAVVKCGLITAKVVNIKEDRTCCECGRIMLKGSLALTSSTRNERGLNVRIHRCIRCGEFIIREAGELSDAYMHEDALADAFSSYT